MNYKIVQRFGPEDGERWEKYLAWRRIELTRFDSLDNILRPDLFNPTSPEDWENCVNEDFKLSIITNAPFAEEILKRFPHAVLVGVESDLDEQYVPSPGLEGYDILDGYCSVSLLANWGSDEEQLVTPFMGENALIHSLPKALELRNLLRNRFPGDPHAQECQVWAVYRITRG